MVSRMQSIRSAAFCRRARKKDSVLCFTGKLFAGQFAASGRWIQGPCPWWGRGAQSPVSFPFVGWTLQKGKNLL